MRFLLVTCLVCWFVNLADFVQGQTSNDTTGAAAVARVAGQRDLLIDVYYRAGNPDDEAWLKRARDYAAKQPGLKVVPRDVASDAALEKTMQSIQSALQLPKTTVPLVYGFNRAIHQVKDDADFAAQMDRLRQLEMYCQPNCPHCDQAEQHLKKTLPQYPAITFVKRNIVNDKEAKAELQGLLKRRNTNTQTVPVLHFANQLLIGFDSQQKSGDKVDELLKRWSWETPAAR
jgi:glutaredoxin